MKLKDSQWAGLMLVFLLMRCIIGTVGVVMVFEYTGIGRVVGLLLIVDAAALILAGAIILRNWVNKEGQGPEHLSATLLRSRFRLVVDE